MLSCDTRPCGTSKGMEISSLPFVLPFERLISGRIKCSALPHGLDNSSLDRCTDAMQGAAKAEERMSEQSAALDAAQKAAEVRTSL